MPGSWNTKTVQGETFKRRLTWKTGEPLSPVNLTGYAAKMQLKSTSGALAAELTSASGITLGGAQGTIDLELEAVDTATIAPGVYRHDLRLTDGSGNVTVLLSGTIEMLPRVTV